MSLSRAFRCAGCPAVAMSLWEADDASTAAVVTGFFQHLKKGGRKSAALRSAALQQLAAEQDEARCHPYFWANLVLTGDDAALVFPEKKQPGVWAEGLAALLLGLAGLLYFKSSNTSSASA